MPRHTFFGLTPSTNIRDSLYDLIPLPVEASRILETSAFLRLDGIQQLGFVSRIWPGARHTRFEHSLGVMHLMWEALDRLTNIDPVINDESARTGIAAALLHDIGHYPFSHAIEELGPPVLSHEQVGRNVILSGEIASILRDQWQVDPMRVANLVESSGQQLGSTDQLIRQLLSGALDVDKLDYLPRDARACHVPYGGVDTSRLLDALRIIPMRGEVSVGIDQKGISPLHSLINARQEMFDNVYWHHTNRACMVMLLRAVQDAVIAGLPAQELTQHTDASLLQRLSQPDQPASTRQLISNLRQRRIHKRAVEISSRSAELYRYLSALFSTPGHRRQMELDLAKRLSFIAGISVGEADVLIDIPKPERWSTNVQVHFDRPPVGFTTTMAWQDVTGMDDINLKAYEEHRRLIRIVVASPLRSVVRRHWEQLLLPLMIQT